MAQSVRNIIVGAANVFVSVSGKTDGTAAAVATSLTSGDARTLIAADTNYVDVGYTTNGLEISYEPNFGEVAVDQSLDAARIFKQAMKVTLKTEFAEATLENLLVAWAQPADAISGKTSTDNAVLDYQGGQLGDYPLERSLQAIGPGPRTASVGKTGQRIYYASRVLSLDTSAHGLKRDTSTTFPVTFRLLPLASASNSYGKITDRIF
jgi:hypothetical protein